MKGNTRAREEGAHAQLNPDLSLSNTPSLRLWGRPCLSTFVPLFGATVYQVN